MVGSGWCNDPHFTDRLMEARQGKATFLKPQSQQVVKEVVAPISQTPVRWPFCHSISL